MLLLTSARLLGHIESFNIERTVQQTGYCITLAVPCQESSGLISSASSIEVLQGCQCPLDRPLLSSDCAELQDLKSGLATALCVSISQYAFVLSPLFEVSCRFGSCCQKVWSEMSHMQALHIISLCLRPLVHSGRFRLHCIKKSRNRRADPGPRLLPTGFVL